VEFIDLQTEARPADEQARAAVPQLKPLGVSLIDFSDTAALVSALDLVITVDTAVAHLAGALGKHVWTLLPKSPDWRWMLDRADSPWYGTMRLFRQTIAGDWAEVVGRVKSELEELASGARGR
jgi:ADP-heptose:LPS heptosyltransferase